jgi:hypothetical protein
MSRRNRVISFSAFLGIAALSAACVQILGIDSTTVADSDSGTTDASTDASDSSVDGSVDAGVEWACLGKHEPPIPVAPATVTITADITDFFSNGAQPSPGLTLHACFNPRDDGCANRSPDFISDANGVAHIAVQIKPPATNFSGYLEVQGAATSGDGGTIPAADGGVEQIVPYIWAFYEPIAQDGEYPLATFSTEEFGLLVNTVQNGATPDPGRGHLAVQATDCTNTAAAGLSLSLIPSADAEGLGFALSGSGETPTAGLNVTDGTGLVGIFNLRAGNTQVTMTRVSTSQPTGAQTVIVRPGWLSTIRMQPNQ